MMVPPVKKKLWSWQPILKISKTLHRIHESHKESTHVATWEWTAVCEYLHIRTRYRHCIVTAYIHLHPRSINPCNLASQSKIHLYGMSQGAAQNLVSWTHIFKIFNYYSNLNSILSYEEKVKLTHWGRVTHICVSKIAIIGSNNGLSPSRRQAIIWTNAGILLIGPLGTNFSEILIEIQTFSFKKMHL